MPVRARLTLVFAGIMAIVLVAGSMFVHARLRATLRDTVDTEVRSRAQVILSALERSRIKLGETVQLVDPGDAFAQVVSPDGSILDSSPGLTRPLAPASALTDLTRPRYFEVTVHTVEESHPARLYAVPADDGSVVVAGTSLDDTKDTLASLARSLWLGAPVALGATTALVWLLAGAALRPVERMRAEAEAFSASEPGRRLHVPRTRDEVARLGETLNRLLARLEEALDRERRFVDDASHELRTPLAILQAEVDLALQRARTPEELEAALRSAGEESERLSRLADHLLVLARSDRGKLALQRGDVDVAQLVSGVVERFQVRAREKDVTIDCGVPQEAEANVDRLRLEQALSNLLDNALRHTPPGGRIGVLVAWEKEALVISVTDTGVGFPPTFLVRAFEPFSRSDDGRNRDQGGAGLGLAIVRAVTEAHGGSVEADNSQAGGASVVMRLPA